MKKTAEEVHAYMAALENLAAEMILQRSPICQACGNEFHITHVGDSIAAFTCFYNVNTEQPLEVPTIGVMCWCTFCYPDDHCATEAVTLGTLPKELLGCAEYMEDAEEGEKTVSSESSKYFTSLEKQAFYDEYIHISELGDQAQADLFAERTLSELAFRKEHRLIMDEHTMFVECSDGEVITSCIRCNRAFGGKGVHECCVD